MAGAGRKGGTSSRDRLLAGALENPAIAARNRDLLAELPGGGHAAAAARNARDRAERAPEPPPPPPASLAEGRRRMFPAGDPLLVNLLPDARIRPHPRTLGALKPEDRVQRSIVAGFDALALEGATAILCIQMANEIRVSVAGEAEDLRASAEMAAFIRAQKRRAWSTAQRLMAMGLLPGAPDLIVLAPGGRLGFAEVKREKGPPVLRERGGRMVRVADGGGSLRPEQRWFRDLAEAWSFPWWLWRSWEQAREDVEAWLSPAPRP